MQPTLTELVEHLRGNGAVVSNPITASILRAIGTAFTAGSGQEQRITS